MMCPTWRARVRIVVAVLTAAVADLRSMIDLAAQYAIASMYCEHGTGQNVRFISRNLGC